MERKKPIKYVNGKTMKENTINELDQYFTSPNTAQKLCETAYEIISKYERENINNYTWVEPSVGDGSFYDNLPEPKIGIDICPLRKEFIQSDYLEYDLPSNTIVIGNPPFGHRGIIALNFINHSSNADYVCFILPMFFESQGKGSIKYRVQGFNLIHSERIPQESFFSYTTNKPVSVKCVFQVWSKNHKLESTEFSWYNNNKKEPFGEYIKVYTVSLAKKRECGKHWIYEEKADFYISSTFHDKISIVDDFSKVKYKSGVAVVFTTQDESIREKIMSIFANADWKKYGSLATNACYHLGKSNIYRVLNDNLKLIEL